jgi:hypothetical protein
MIYVCTILFGDFLIVQYHFSNYGKMIYDISILAMRYDIKDIKEKMILPISEYLQIVRCCFKAKSLYYSEYSMHGWLNLTRNSKFWIPNFSDNKTAAAAVLEAKDFEKPFPYNMQFNAKFQTCTQIHRDMRECIVLVNSSSLSFLSHASNLDRTRCLAGCEESLVP